MADKSLQALRRSACSEFLSFYKDLYRSPAGFPAWNNYLLRCAFYGNPKIIEAAGHLGDRTLVCVGAVCLGVLGHQGPARFLSAELCEAFKRTPEPEITEDILDVMPFMHLILPKGALVTVSGEEVLALVIKTGQLHPHLTESESEQFKKQMDSFADLPIISSELQGAKGIMVAAITADASYSWVHYLDPDARKCQEESYDDNTGVEMDEEELKDTTLLLRRIAINSLLIHLYEPELITVDSAPPKVKGTGFGKVLGRSPLSVTWIGKSFTRSSASSEMAGSTGESRGPVRAHWRRGHWRTVLFGERRSERRLQWIRPVFVNALVAAAAS